MTENKTENEYLELAEDAKKKYDEMDKKIQKKNHIIFDLKKKIACLYGLAKSLNIMIDNTELGQDPEVTTVSDLLRAQATEMLSECFGVAPCGCEIENHHE